MTKLNFSIFTIRLFVLCACSTLAKLKSNGTYHQQNNKKQLTVTSFSFTGAVQSLTIPAGVTSITVDITGASGGAGVAGRR